MIWFTADLHLNHFNVIRYCNRPFSSTQEMNDVIIRNINSLVKKDDQLWILGDFAFRCNANYINKIFFDDIICNYIYLIKGSHDKQPSIRFKNIYDLYQLRVDKQVYVLSHCPFAIWEKKHYGSYNLCGHSHNTYGPSKIDGIENGLQLDVGVDAHNFFPINIDDINRIMTHKKELIAKSKVI